MKNKFGYESYDDGINEVIEDYAGSAFLSLRQVRWTDGRDYTLDLRRYYIDKNGNEVPGKGLSFKTDQGPTNLVKAFIKHDCCDNVEITKALMEHDQDSLVQGIAESIPNDEMLDEFRYKYESAWSNMSGKEKPESAKDALDKLFEKKEE